MPYKQIPNMPQIISLSSDTLLEGVQSGSSGKLSVGQIVSFASSQAETFTNQLLLEELGVVGNGTGDQSAAIAAALAFANGKKLLGTPGSTYRITNTITYSGTYNIDWAGSNLLCDANVPALDISSGIDEVYYLSSNYVVGSTAIPVNDTGSALAQGRKVKIISDAVDPSNRDSGSSASQYRLTEWFVSGNGSTTTNLVLQAPLSDTIGINPVSVPGEESRVQAYTTALNARLIVLPEEVSFNDENLNLSYTTGASWSSTAVFVRGFDNPFFVNTKINNSYDSGLAISGCYNPVVSEPKATNIVQYGIAFSGSFGGMVTNPYVENTRHGITTSSSKATANSTNMNTLLAVGRNPNVFISGGYGGGNPGFAAFDTHHDAKDCVFSCQHTKDTGGFAMQARGTGHKFMSPIVRNSEYGLLALTEYGSGDPDEDYFTAGKLPSDVTNLQIDSPDIEVSSQAVVSNTAYLFLSGVGFCSSIDPRVIWSNGSKIKISGEHNFVVNAGNAVSGQGLIEVNAVNPIMTTAIDIAEVVIDGNVTIDARFATGGAVEGIAADTNTRVVINGTLTLMMPSDSGNLFAGSGEIVTRGSGVVRYSKEGGPDSGQSLNISGRDIRCEAIDGTSSIRMISNLPFSSRTTAESAKIPAFQSVLSYRSGMRNLDFYRDASGTALTTSDGATWSPLGDVYGEHFGTIGGDSLDASPALNAAAAWLAAREIASGGRGGVLHLMQTHYLCRTPVFVSQRVSIVGSHKQECQLIQDADSRGPVLWLLADVGRVNGGDSPQTQLRNFCIDGHNAGVVFAKAAVTDGSPSITVDDATGIVPGMICEANGFVITARVISVVGTTVTMDVNATATVPLRSVLFREAVDVSCDTTDGSKTVIAAAATNIKVGHLIVGTGIPSATYVLTKSGNTLGLSREATTTGTATMTFSAFNSGVFAEDAATTSPRFRGPLIKDLLITRMSGSALVMRPNRHNFGIWSTEAVNCRGHGLEWNSCSDSVVVALQAGGCWRRALQISTSATPRIFGSEVWQTYLNDKYEEFRSQGNRELTWFGGELQGRAHFAAAPHVDGLSDEHHIVLDRINFKWTTSNQNPATGTAQEYVYNDGVHGLTLNCHFAADRTDGSCPDYILTKNGETRTVFGSHFDPTSVAIGLATSLRRIEFTVPYSGTWTAGIADSSGHASSKTATGKFTITGRTVHATVLNLSGINVTGLTPTDMLRITGLPVEAADDASLGEIILQQWQSISGTGSDLKPRVLAGQNYLTIKNSDPTGNQTDQLVSNLKTNHGSDIPAMTIQYQSA